VNPKWRHFLLRRLTRLVVVLAGLVIATFALIHVVPGDPARAIAGAQADQNAVERAREELGLNDPAYVQFGDYLSGLVRLDFGDSFETDEPVTKVISRSIGPTAELAAFGMAIILFVGIPLGLLGGALSQEGNRKFELGFSGLTGIMAALPDYLTATVLALVFAVSLQWLPVAGAATLSAAILPAIAIAVRPMAMVSRLVRIRTLDVLEQDYIRSARSKRLSPRALYGRHVAPNALAAALSVAGIAFAALVGGAVIVEQVFARPGLGTELVQGLLVKNYPVVQGIILTLGAAIVIVNAIVDATLALVDPRTLEGEL